MLDEKAGTKTLVLGLGLGLGLGFYREKEMQERRLLPRVTKRPARDNALFGAAGGSVKAFWNSA